MTGQFLFSHMFPCTVSSKVWGQGQPPSSCPCRVSHFSRSYWRGKVLMVCVCVCVCERERTGERKREKERTVDGLDANPRSLPGPLERGFFLLLIHSVQIYTVNHWLGGMLTNLNTPLNTLTTMPTFNTWMASATCSGLARLFRVPFGTHTHIYCMDGLCVFVCLCVCVCAALQCLCMQLTVHSGHPCVGCGFTGSCLSHTLCSSLK